VAPSAVARGQFVAPTVLTHVTHEMRVMREETFGPVMAIARVSGEEEAIRLANDTEYGLGSTVFSRDPARARRIARAIVAGSTVVNDFGLHYMANALPFGGVRGSGFGRLNGREGIRAMTNVKAVLEDRLPLHAANRLYPVGPERYGSAKRAIEMLYRRSWLTRAGSALELVRAMLSGKRS
jgi:acyl-CoA reductase-like NAD-dependent aldehyde dehydrogenase